MPHGDYSFCNFNFPLLKCTHLLSDPLFEVDKVRVCCIPSYIYHMTLLQLVARLRGYMFLYQMKMSGGFSSEINLRDMHSHCLVRSHTLIWLINILVKGVNVIFFCTLIKKCRLKTLMEYFQC